MPWKELCQVSLREEFVLKVMDLGANVSELCREYGISRKTGYKWKERYEEGGIRALEDMSRRPQVSPLRVSGDVVAEVVAIRLAHPRWGPRKIGVIVREQDGEGPSDRTVARILERAGFIQPVRRRRLRQSGAVPPPKVEYRKPNDLWTVDFKGWWLTGNGTRCEPLTIRDAYSRFVIEARAVQSTSLAEVRPIFEETFRRLGLPKAIQSDNGPPFVSRGPTGLTNLSTWWLSLGIEHIRSRPAKPSDNGGHERMHRDVAEEVEAISALSLKAQQKELDRWRHDFNHHRPHESLGMKTPASVYRRSAVEYTGKPTELIYPPHFAVRLGSNVGMVTHRSRRVFICKALAHRPVGLERVRQRVYAIWFANRKLGYVDFSEEPAVFSPAA